MPLLIFYTYFGWSEKKIIQTLGTKKLVCSCFFGLNLWNFCHEKLKTNRFWAKQDLKLWALVESIKPRLWSQSFSDPLHNWLLSSRHSSVAKAHLSSSSHYTLFKKSGDIIGIHFHFPNIEKLHLHSCIGDWNFSPGVCCQSVLAISPCLVRLLSWKLTTMILNLWNLILGYPKVYNFGYEFMRLCEIYWCVPVECSSADFFIFFNLAEVLQIFKTIHSKFPKK